MAQEKRKIRDIENYYERARARAKIGKFDDGLGWEDIDDEPLPPGKSLLKGATSNVTTKPIGGPTQPPPSAPMPHSPVPSGQSASPAPQPFPPPQDKNADVTTSPLQQPYKPKINSVNFAGGMTTQPLSGSDMVSGAPMTTQPLSGSDMVSGAPMTTQPLTSADAMTSAPPHPPGVRPPSSQPASPHANATSEQRHAAQAHFGTNYKMTDLKGLHSRHPDMHLNDLRLASGLSGTIHLDHSHVGPDGKKGTIAVKSGLMSEDESRIAEKMGREGLSPYVHGVKLGEHSFDSPDVEQVRGVIQQAKNLGLTQEKEHPQEKRGAHAGDVVNSYKQHLEGQKQQALADGDLSTAKELHDLLRGVNRLKPSAIHAVAETGIHDSFENADKATEIQKNIGRWEPGKYKAGSTMAMEYLAGHKPIELTMRTLPGDADGGKDYLETSIGGLNAISRLHSNNITHNDIHGHNLVHPVQASLDSVDDKHDPLDVRVLDYGMAKEGLAHGSTDWPHYEKFADSAIHGMERLKRNADELDKNDLYYSKLDDLNDAIQDLKYGAKASVTRTGANGLWGQVDDPDGFSKKMAEQVALIKKKYENFRTTFKSILDWMNYGFGILLKSELGMLKEKTQRKALDLMIERKNLNRKMVSMLGDQKDPVHDTEMQRIQMRMHEIDDEVHRMGGLPLEMMYELHLH